MTVRQPMWFILGAILTVLAGYFLVDRLQFTWVSQETIGSVTRLTAHNDRCGSRRNRHACTKYQADIRYEVNAKSYMLNVEAGSVRGYDRPLSEARYAVGSRVRVAYDPGKPARAYRNTTFDIWGAPIVTIFFQVVSFFASFKERRR